MVVALVLHLDQDHHPNQRNLEEQEEEHLEKHLEDQESTNLVSRIHSRPH